MSFRRALAWSLFYVLGALVSGVALGVLGGWDLGGQYFAAYLVEKSLSVDNLFVFVIILSRFAVPAELQPRALSVGIALALALRAVLIAFGAVLISAFSFMFLVFGLALLITALQLLRHRKREPSAGDNALVVFARRALPVSAAYEGTRIFTRLDGRRAITPLLLVLVALGSTDVVFALDSIPAVFGVTQHPLIVFAANLFALLGLRALYFLVSGLLERLVFLSIGLAVILAFIGVKLVLHFGHTVHHGVPEISTGASLGVILVVLAITTVASLRRARADTGSHPWTETPPQSKLSSTTKVS
jgi:tellurite resistance protein TerC